MFDERAYGFASLVDLLRAAQKDGIVRMDRDRQGVVRVFQGTAAVATQIAAATAEPQPEVAAPASVVEAQAEPEAAGEPDISVGPGNVEQPIHVELTHGRRRPARPAAPRARAAGASRRPRKPSKSG